MKLLTDRLILREVESQDAKDLVKLLNNINVTRWMLVFPHPYTKKDAKQYVSRAEESRKEKPRKSYSFSIELRNSKDLIGGINLSKIDFYQGTAITSYWLGQDYWRNGYGSEAFQVLLDFAFKKLKLRRISGSVYPGNPSSGKLLEKYGFKREGYSRESHFCKADGKIKDSISYGLLRSEYKVRK